MNNINIGNCATFEIVGKLYIEVIYRPNNGRKFYFPVSPDANLIVDLFERKCFTQRQIKLMAEYGWKINVVQDIVDDFSN